MGNAATTQVAQRSPMSTAAKTLIIAIPNAFEAGQAVEQCRKHNPKPADRGAGPFRRGSGLSARPRRQSGHHGRARDRARHARLDQWRECASARPSGTRPISKRRCRAVRSTRSLTRAASRTELLRCRPNPPFGRRARGRRRGGPSSSTSPRGRPSRSRWSPAYGETPLAEDEREPPALVVAGGHGGARTDDRGP